MKKILVIEDENTVRLGIVDLLNEEGFDVYEAENGRTGIEIARKILPDLVISDILMPEIDGYAVLRELQNNEETSSIPLIFLSAKTEKEDIRAGMNIGADDYLTKPYKANDLLNAVHSRLKKTERVEEKFEKVYNNIVRNLPHEFRTPLVSIIGFSQIIKDSCGALSAEELDEMSSKINKSGYDLLRMIQKFLSFSELEMLLVDNSYNKKEVFHPVTTGEIEIYAASIANRYERLGDLSLSVTDASPEITEEHFKILLEEIIDNAFKFSSPGKEVNIKSYVEGDSLAVEIKDEGVGMNEEMIKRIGLLRQFERDVYFQNGLGLGLTICKKIVQIYKGKLQFESVIREFTKVKIALPLSGR